MEICPLTRHQITLRQDGGRMLFYYDNPVLGTIKFTDVALGIVEHLDDRLKNILKGIIRNNRDEGNSPIEIDSKFLNNLDNLDIPYDFESRARYFLKYLYDHGGKTYELHNLNSASDSSIVYCSKGEFEKIIRYLEKEGFIEYNKITPTNTTTFYKD